MSKITKYALSDLYDMSSGISSKKEQAGHGAPFVSFGTVFNNYFLPEELPDLMDTNEKEQQIYSIKTGDVLITRTSETIDELAMSCVAVKDYPKATYSGFTKRLRPKREGIAYPKYMAFYFRSALFRKAVTNNAFMTLRASFNEDIFTFLDVYLPDYDEQVRIGDMLYNIECKIQKNKEINDYLEEMAKTLYDYWFVQFEFPDENGNPYKSTGGKMSRTKDFGLAPCGWKFGNLYDIAEFINGLACQKYRPMEDEASLPVIKIKEMHDGISSDTERVKATIPEKNIVNTGDILFSWSASLEVQHWAGTTGGLNQHIFKVIPKKGYSSSYVYHQLQAYVIKFIQMADARKTTMGHITSDHLRQSIIVLPPENIVRNFSQQVDDIHAEINHINIENLRLSQLRDWLLPMLMNGQATIED